MLDEYFEAFSRYLRTGEAGRLPAFCDRRADRAYLRIYRNGFFKACVDALRSNYPSVERLVGETFFSALARRYVAQHPPRVASLVEYGQAFPVFLEERCDIHRLEYLASIALLDRAWLSVYFAEDLDTLDAAVPVRDSTDAEAISNLRCRLAPAVRLVTLDFAVLDVWAKLRLEELRETTEIRRATEHALIWRLGGGVSYRSLSAPEHVFIDQIGMGLTCGEAAGAALDVDGGFDVAETFASLLQHRMLATRH